MRCDDRPPACVAECWRVPPGSAGDGGGWSALLLPFALAAAVRA
jgi:hypothetical protein